MYAGGGCINPTNSDTDADGALGGQEVNHALFPTLPYDDDTDDDGDLDGFDNCPLEPNEFQEDQDSDGVGDLCDNCDSTVNSAQGDVDEDLDGDACDLDDGHLILHVEHAGLVTWQEDTNYLAYNLYRGVLDAMVNGGGGYTQFPAIPGSMRFCGVGLGQCPDGYLPQPGETLFYLVDGTPDGYVESTLGPDTSGTRRPNTSPCLQAAPAALYPLDSDADDYSGNFQHGFLGGATFVSGVFGNALHVDQNGFDYADLPHTTIDGASDFSFSAFVRIDGNNVGNTLVSGARSLWDDALVIGYDGLAGNPGWRMSIDNTTFVFAGSTQMQDLGWHHIAVIREGTAARLYVDGARFGEIAVNNLPIDLDEGGLFLGQELTTLFGQFQPGGSWWGTIDDMRIYNRAITDEEVQAHAAIGQ